MVDQISSRLGQHSVTALLGATSIILGEWGVWPSQEHLAIPVGVRILLVLFGGGFTYLGLWFLFISIQKSREDELSFAKQWKTRSQTIALLLIVIFLAYVLYDSIETTQSDDTNMAHVITQTPSPTTTPDGDKIIEEPPKFDWGIVIPIILITVLIISNISDGLKKAKRENLLQIRKQLEVAGELSGYRHQGRRLLRKGKVNIKIAEYNQWLEDCAEWKTDLDSYIQLNLDKKYYSKLFDPSN
ncbi:MAG: hypothetical protein PVF83_15350, partial [Anaerolineales bacterium]